MKVWLSAKGTLADLSAEISYRAAALEEAASRGARFLALPVENTREAATWILASFHSPITVVPLPPSLPLPALEQRLAQLPSGTAMLPEALTISRSKARPLKQRPLNEIWAVIFTSGSSGQPKGVALHGHALRASAFAHAEHNGDHSWLLDLPLYHVGGLSVISRSLFLGSGLALGSTRFDPSETLSWIQSGLVQGISLVPTTLFRLLKNESANFSALRIALLGGSAADEELLAKAGKRGLPVRLTYGMTEHASQIATEKTSGGGLRPLPGVEVFTAAVGEILVRSPNLAAGIFQAGALTPLPLKNGFLSTGDLGELQAGKLRVLGRKSDLIISGGMNIFPVEVEKEISLLPEVLDCAVSSLPDPEWGEMLCAAVVEQSPGAFDPLQAKHALAQKLEIRKIPKRWVVTPSVPRASTGKILRAELKALVSKLAKPIPTHS
jgi:o-succinylbenzoate---CoA ligase